MGKVNILFENVHKSYFLYHKLGGCKNFLLNFHKIVREIDQYRHKVLQGVSFEIYSGQQMGFIGSNGAGKSTLLSLIAGIIRQDKGKITVSGRVSPLLELGAGFHPELTGYENIYLNAILIGMRKKEIDRKIDAIMEFSELKDFIYQPIRTYSSGMVARLGFSVAIHMDPDILLIDEILGVGDWHFQEKCYQKICEFKRKNTTIIMVSHNMDALEKLCDSVIWLKSGQIAEAGENIAEISVMYKNSKRDRGKIN